jgi:tRNA uridine 5-carboxymethylaminomethyl modification enzyme
LKGEPPLALDRSQAYIGVLIDDLITKDTQEPYRMFTSRAEYRLLLRHSNADLRLMEIGYKLGLVEPQSYDRLARKKQAIDKEVERLQITRPHMSERILENTKGTFLDDVSAAQTLAQILRRQEATYKNLLQLLDLPLIEDPEVADEVELQIKYEGYISRQLKQVAQMKKFEQRAIPQSLDYERIPGFSREVREKLKKVRPETLGQASRISGITPAAVSLLMVAIEKYKTDIS